MRLVYGIFGGMIVSWLYLYILWHSIKALIGSVAKKSTSAATDEEESGKKDDLDKIEIGGIYADKIKNYKEEKAETDIQVNANAGCSFLVFYLSFFIRFIALGVAVFIFLWTGVTDGLFIMYGMLAGFAVGLFYALKRSLNDRVR